MSTTVILDDLDLEFEIEDPEDQGQWISAIKAYCDEFAKTHYNSRFYREQSYDISDEVKGLAANAISIAIRKYRDSEPTPGVDSATQWKSILSMHLEDMMNDDFSQHDGLNHGNFEDLYSALDEAMAEIDGPVCDLDSLYEELQNYTIGAMENNDESTVLDYFAGVEIPLAFTPGYDPLRNSIDDLSMYFHDIQGEGPYPQVRHLLELFRLPGEVLLGEFSVDYTQVDVLERWDYMMGMRFEHPPLLSAEALVTLMDNAGQNTIPLWVGKVPFQSLLSVDFKQDVQLSGGVLGAHNMFSGSGDMSAMDEEQYIVITPKDILYKEFSYTTEETYGFTNSIYSAKIRQQPVKPAVTREIDGPAP